MTDLQKAILMATMTNVKATKVGWTVFATVVVALVFVGGSSAAVSPWKWTPVKAGAKVGGKCIGRGAVVSGRFTAFRCVVNGKVVWVKVRRSGAGKACVSRVSLARVPVACLKVPPVVAQGDESLAYMAVLVGIQKRLRPESKIHYQAITDHVCVRTSPSSFACSFSGPQVEGSAVVSWPGPLMRFTSFVCQPETRAQSPAGCA